MSDDAAVVWLEPGAPDDDAARSLAAWAAARGVRIVAPREDRAPASGADAGPALAEQIEHDIARAHEAIASAETDGAERALARAEETLRNHPELLQAAWLRAEVERTWSARWLRATPRDEARARAAWENAHALDGGRVAGIGESAFPPPPRVRTRLVVDGPTARLELRVDGVVVTGTAAAYEVELSPGTHHVLATSAGRVAFAAWVATATENAPISLAIGDGGACSRDDLGRARRSAADPQRVEAAGVGCASWVAALPGERRGSVLVARCERDACGPLLEWRTERLGGAAAAPQATRAGSWPSWATWTLVGIGAASAASVALVATGVFEARRVEQRFVVGGARQE